jgi:D-alanine transaminase
METVILNGELIDRKDASIDVEDRGYQFGDGIYEVIRVYNGKMFTAAEHLERFQRSAENIGMNVSYSIGELTALLQQLIKKNSLELGIVYMQMSRGISPRNHAFPAAETKPTLVAYTREMARPEKNMQTGIKAMLTEDIRWLRCDIKSLNLLGNLLAKQKAVEAGCFEAIQHRGETVTEGSSSNILIVKDGKVLTHPANNLILNGITRMQLEQICVNNNIPFEERTFTMNEMLLADEVIMTSTTSEVMPVCEIDGKRVNEGVPGSVTQKLQELFTAEIEKQCGELVYSS